MKPFVLALAVAVAAAAQLPYRTGRHTMFQLENGVNVMATTFSQSGSESDEVRFGKLEWKGNAVNRTLVLRDGTPWFGYSMKVEAAAPSQLRVSVERYNGYPFFEAAPEARVVVDGSTVELDVLENPLNGEKLKDSYQVSRREVAMPSGFRFEPRADPSSQEPRDVRLPNLQFRLESPRILRNGKPLDPVLDTDTPSRGTVTGGVTGFRLPEDGGLVLLSWRKQPRYGFEKVGVADGTTLRFRLGADEYEIRTQSPAAPADGRFYFWVGQDREYRGAGQMVAYGFTE